MQTGPLIRSKPTRDLLSEGAPQTVRRPAAEAANHPSTAARELLDDAPIAAVGLRRALAAAGVHPVAAAGVASIVKLSPTMATCSTTTPTM